MVKMADSESQTDGFSISLKVVIDDNELPQILLLFINTYLPPFVLVFGLLGNIFAFVIFRQPHYSRQTTCLYMQSVAVSDSLVFLVVV